MTERVVIMAGGTGGHVFPALAIAHRLRAMGVEILWLGTRGRLEEELVPRHHYDIAYIDVRGLRRNGLRRKLGAPFMIARAVAQARRVLRDFDPAVVLGMGGYASGPGGLAAWLLGIPVVLHEQNAAAGLTNRLLSRVASRILLGFPGAFAGPRVRVVGNPVREEIAALRGRGRPDFRRSTLHVLVLGGSLGAAALNELVPRALKLLAASGAALEVVHQCGREHVQNTSAHYEGAAFAVQVTPFIEDMARAYLGSDLVICRAGALTVSEITAAQVPALFIPLPTAVDDHQYKNAMTLAGCGAGLCIRQGDLEEQGLCEVLRDLWEDRSRLEAMHERLSALPAGDACAEVVAELGAFFASGQPAS